MQTGHRQVVTVIVNRATIEIAQTVENELRKLSQAVLSVRFFMAASVSALNRTFKELCRFEGRLAFFARCRQYRQRYETAAPHNRRLSVDLHPVQCE